MITNYLVEKAIESALTYSMKLLNNVKSRLGSNANDIQSAISYHLTSVSNWCSEISFSDLKHAKLTSQVFVELNMYLYPRRLRIDSHEVIDAIPLRNIFQDKSRHFILLGQPGAGKTTSMKYLCSKLLHDSDFYPDQFNFPIVIKLRELNVELSHRSKDDPVDSLNSIIFKYLYKVLGLEIQFSDDLLESEEGDRRSELIERIVVRFLEDMKVMLILDGFDELTLSQHRDIALSEIRKLAQQLQTATLIVTSRTGEFPYSIDNTSQFEICPLDKEQISQFSHKWLENKEQVDKFLKEIAQSPFADATIKPLTLAHLCAIFERVGKIPDKPKTVYRKIVNLLLEEWDEQRSVRRMSRYANFEIDRKFEFLCNLAYELTTTFSTSVFSEEDLLLVYDKIYINFDLEKNEAKEVIGELESHTGLFIQAGYQTFEFAHKSLQEYLTAEYIVKLPRLPNKYAIIQKLPNELAIAVTISSNPSSYFNELVFSILYSKSLPPYFYESFVNRLIQEKPDFNTFEELVLALVVLYSLYLDEMLVKESGQLKLIYVDNLVDQFEEFVSLLCKRNPKDIIHKFYRKERIVQTTEGSQILHLQKYRDLKEYNLPAFLYARPSFLGDK